MSCAHSDNKAQQIEQEIIEFMRSFRKKDIVAMYDPRLAYEVYWVSLPFTKDDVFRNCYVCYDCDKCNSLKLYYFNHSGQMEEVTVSNSKQLKDILKTQEKDDKSRGENTGKNTGNPLRIKVEDIKASVQGHSPPDEYRIQLHFRNAEGKYSEKTYQKVLKFFYKYYLGGLKMVELFEQTFSRLICENMRNMKHDAFLQVKDKETDQVKDKDKDKDKDKEVDPEDLRIDAKYMESRGVLSREEMKKLKKEDYEFKIVWLTLNKSADLKTHNMREDLWDVFFDSLSKGFGTVGFQDYVGAITLRGAMTPVKNGNMEYKSVRSNQERFLAQLKQIKILRCDLNKVSPKRESTPAELDQKDSLQLKPLSYFTSSTWQRYCILGASALLAAYGIYRCFSSSNNGSNDKSFRI